MWHRRHFGFNIFFLVLCAGLWIGRARGRRRFISALPPFILVFIGMQWRYIQLLLFIWKRCIKSILLFTFYARVQFSNSWSFCRIKSIIKRQNCRVVLIKYTYYYQYNYLPRNVEQMYSDIWFPDLLDSEKWLSSLLSILLNCNIIYNI